MTKEEWIQTFEEIHNRKPTATEFIEAKNSGEFAGEEESNFIDTENSNNVQLGNNMEIYCHNCGSINDQDCSYCVSCGDSLTDYSNSNLVSDENLDGLKVENSFLSDFSSKLKELTNAAQAQGQIFKLKKHRDNLWKLLGKTYYERYCNNPNEDLKSLIVEIDRCEQEIHSYSEQLNRK